MMTAETYPAGASILSVTQHVQREEFRLDVSLRLPHASAIGLYGPSGSGKSTLLRCLAGLEPGCEGRLHVGDACWQDDGSRLFLPAHRRSVGYVFQDNRLFPHLSVLGNLRYGLAGKSSDQLDTAITLFNLGALLKRKPHRLSGGEQRRVAVARALARGPSLLLLDEPMTGLDAEQKDEVLPYLDRLRVQFSLPMIYVSHHIDEIIRLCDFLVRMEQGRVLASGPLDEVLMRHDLPMLAGDEASSVITGQIASHDERYGMTRVTCDYQDLLLSGHHGQPGEKLRLRILARDVSLCLSQPRDSSIQNILPVTIEAFSDAGAAQIDVSLSLGQQKLIARITHRAREKLKLGVGQKLFAQIKSVAVRQTQDS